MATALQASDVATQNRVLFVDNIRWALIVVVICHHGAVTYSHVGGWYYLDGPKPGLVTTGLFATLETFDQAFFMGLLFLLAGYFVPRAFDKKGFGRFVRDRAIRLGIPSLFFMLVIHPFTVYWLLHNYADPSIPSLPGAYEGFLASGKVLSATGPMWFAVALLIFCIVYGGVRLMLPGTPRKITSLSGHKAVLALILLMGTCSFLVRISQPIGVNILNMQLCYFSQYVLLFAVGVLAYRGDWLLRIPYSFGMFWMKLALRAGTPLWFLILATSGALRGDSRRLLGGFSWQSAAFCFWEAFFCVGMCLGLTVLFRDKFNRQGPFSKWMSGNSFSAYLFHTPLLVAVTLALRGLVAPPAMKFVVACLLAAPITFIVSGFIRERIPGLRRLL